MYGFGVDAVGLQQVEKDPLRCTGMAYPGGGIQPPGQTPTLRTAEILESRVGSSCEEGKAPSFQSSKKKSCVRCSSLVEVVAET